MLFPAFVREASPVRIDGVFKPYSIWRQVRLGPTLGLAANLTIFAWVDAKLIRSLPFPNADRLVIIFNSYPKESSVSGISGMSCLGRRFE